MPAKGTLKCFIEGCGGPVSAKRLCNKHYLRQRITGDPLTPLSDSKLLADAAEQAVYSILRAHGRDAKRCKPNAHSDIICDGWHIDVKCSSSKCNPKFEQPIWKFSIMTNRTKSEDCCDFYILRFLDVPFCDKAIHMLFKSPMVVKGSTITFRSILNTYSQNIRDFHAFCRGEYGNAKPRLEAVS